jgi:hypothetical protein
VERELPELAEIYREVADSLTWMRFCLIMLGNRVPHPSTLGKLTKPVGPVAHHGASKRDVCPVPGPAARSRPLCGVLDTGADPMCGRIPKWSAKLSK